MLTTFAHDNGTEGISAVIYLENW